MTTPHRRRISSILIYIFAYFTFQQNPCYSNPCHGKFSVCQVGFTDRGFRCIGNVLSKLPNTILLTCSLNFFSKIKLLWPLFITCDKYWKKNTLETSSVDHREICNPIKKILSLTKTCLLKLRIYGKQEIDTKKWKELYMDEDFQKCLCCFKVRL